MASPVPETANSNKPSLFNDNIENDSSPTTWSASQAPQPLLEPQPPQELEVDIDYNKIYEGLQERFNKVYSISQKLFVTEKTQRQTMYYYKRRNDALLDLLCELEDCGDEDLDTPTSFDHERIANIISEKPELGEILDPVLQIALGEDASNIKVKDSYNVDLAVNESIPDIVNDELDTVEVNPQDTEMWTRRNYAHLVISKFKPVEIRGKGVREYINSPTLNTKRKKKLMAKE